MKQTSNKRRLVGDVTSAEFTCASILFSVALLFSLAALTIHAQGAPANGPKSFASAQAAAEALVAATETFDEAALKEILGPYSHDIIYSDEPVRDRETAMEFGKMGRAKITLTPAPRNKNLVLLGVGEDKWPCPIPIVKTAAGWKFDVVAGREELIYRRIGRDELEAIDISRGYVEAQHEYALQKHDGAPVNQYAQRIISSPGKQDGLAWRNPDGSVGGPIAENVSKAIERGYNDPAAPYSGYYFKILKGQGPAAPLGKLDYVVGGYMIGGFALVAFPSIYRVTGVKTFIVSQDGVVYEKDLGPKTSEIAKNMELFNPDKTWAPVLEDEDEDDDDN
jgi:hypothetical protein